MKTRVGSTIFCALVLLAGSALGAEWLGPNPGPLASSPVTALDITLAPAATLFPGGSPGTKPRPRIQTWLQVDNDNAAYITPTPDWLYSGNPCQTGAPCVDWGMATRFTTEHRARLLQIEAVIYTNAAAAPFPPIDMYVWADVGGQKPDQNRILGGPFTITPTQNNAALYTVDISAANIVVEAYQDFHVGSIWTPFNPQAVPPGVGSCIVLDDGEPNIFPRWTLYDDFSQSDATIAGCIPWPTWYIIGVVDTGDPRGPVQLTPMSRIQVDYLDADIIPPQNRIFFDDTATTALLPAGRGAWGDYDNDGDDDLYDGTNGLWRNPGNGTAFQNVSGAAGLPGGVIGGIWGDLDNDGDLDIVTYGGAGERVYRNQLIEGGTATFTDVTAAAGLVDDNWPTTAIALGDINRDGLVDVYLANLQDCAHCPMPDEWRTFYTDSCDFTDNTGGTAPGPNPCEWFWGAKDWLFLNNGNFTFTDVTTSSGIEAQEEKTYSWQDVDADTYRDIVEDPNGTYIGYYWSRGAAMADYDNDGDMDIWVPTYYLNPDFLWVNEGDWYMGTGAFVNQAMTLGIAGRTPIQACTDLGITGAWGHGAGGAWMDVNHDAYLDLVEPNLAHSNWLGWSDRTRMWINNGSGGFIDHTTGSAIPYMETDMCAYPADYDNDGWEDLYVSSVYADWFGRMFHANGDAPNFTFAFSSYPTAVYQDDIFQSGAWNDYDMDGDLDFFAQGTMWRNRARVQFPNNQFLKVKVEGCCSNFSGIGTRIVVTDPLNNVQVRQVEGGYASGSQDGMTVHFGLGSAVSANVEVTFPNGQVKTVNNAPSGNTVTVTEDGCRFDQGPLRACAGSSLSLSASTCGGAWTIEWDLDGDGVFETTGSPAQANFPTGGEAVVGLRAMNGPVELCRSYRRIFVEEPPTFAPAVTVLDLPCPGQGVRLEWTAATFHSADAQGTYAVYRADWTGASCGAFTEIAHGITDLFFDAPTPAPGNYCFRIVAEDSTVNSGCTPQGPNNSGATTQYTEQNVPDTVDPTPPNDVGDTLRLAKQVAANRILLTWQAEPNPKPASTYEVRRSPDFATAFQTISPPGYVAFGYQETAWQNGALYYYVTRVLDACGTPSMADPW